MAEGDPRVLWAMNLLLSMLFGWILVSSLAFVGVVEFTLETFAATVLFLMVVTWLVVLR